MGCVGVKKRKRVKKTRNGPGFVGWKEKNEGKEGENEKENRKKKRRKKNGKEVSVNGLGLEKKILVLSFGNLGFEMGFRFRVLVFRFRVWKRFKV